MGYIKKVGPTLKIYSQISQISQSSPSPSQPHPTSPALTETPSINFIVCDPYSKRDKSDYQLKKVCWGQRCIMHDG